MNIAREKSSPSNRIYSGARRDDKPFEVYMLSDAKLYKNRQVCLITRRVK